MLTEEQIEYFYREGYVLAEGLVPMTAIDAVMSVARPLVRETDFWQPTIFDHKDPANRADLHRLLWEPAIVGAVEQVFASPARIYYGMLAIVPAGGGKGLPWHQDNQYSHILGGALNCFIALDHITPDMANLWVAPRSHLAGVRPSHGSDAHHGHREADVAPDNGLCLPPLKPGDACIFDRCTLHRSLVNQSDRPRFAYAAQYQSDHAREAATGRKDPLRMRASELRETLAAAPRKAADT